MRLTPNLTVGTSGWTYDGWRGPFYPADIPKRLWLQHYSSVFPTTEINGSFYRTPSLEAVEAWRAGTPEGFLFAWKASKFITHWKRLGPTCDTSLELMETRLEVLGPKLGTILFQLPARFKADPERLAEFLGMLNPRRRYSFEFRDASWYDDRVYAVLREKNVALCISDHHDAPAPWVVTADHVYIRGHGPTGEYRDRYAPRTLRKWAEEIRKYRRRKLAVCCYFDNDQKSAAPLDAARLVELLAAKTVGQRAAQA
ncbi:MAG TPA: DUF72 domain-containing protein [Lacipirellulaceae bacterium]|nr:DUF72 domain-containing protein [Lacipirellulaceae bacterium]